MHDQFIFIPFVVAIGHGLDGGHGFWGGSWWLWIDWHEAAQPNHFNIALDWMHPQSHLFQSTMGLMGDTKQK